MMGSETAPAPDPHLSIVAVSRNDDHGGDMRGRMQHFVDGFIAQCRRHRLRAELILVEWNPPPDRPPLEDALTWPADFGPAEVRIVTVPPEIHAGFAHSAQLPLFQMMGKNVGIRRARGRYVLATNVDILFDDEIVGYMRDGLTPGTMLRVDRYDVPGDLPGDATFERVLADCAKRFFHVNTRFGVFDVRTRRGLGLGANLAAQLLNVTDAVRILGAIYRDRLLGRRSSASWSRRILAVVVHSAAAARVAAGFFLDAARFSGFLARKLWPPREIPMRALRLGRIIARRSVSAARRAARLAASIARRFASFVGLRRPESDLVRRLRSSRWLHTNACGDFTLLAREDWFRLRGYPDWPIYSWHLDSMLMFAAHARGLRQVILGARYRIFHIDHSIGSGWSPAGGDLLFARLRARAIPYLSDDELRHWRVKFADDPDSAIINGVDWGLGERELPERRILPHGRRAAVRDDAGVRSSDADV